jgi:acetyl-CoA acetyltransferase
MATSDQTVVIVAGARTPLGSFNGSHYSGPAS